MLRRDDMDSRERVRRAVTFQGLDRTPVELWILPGILWKYGPQIEALLKRYPVDIVGAEQSAYDDSAMYQRGEFLDPWGVLWHNEQPGVFSQVKAPPLADYAALENYQPPYELLDRGFEGIAAFIERDRGKFIKGAFIRIFERMQWLRGMAALMMDLMDDRLEVYRLRDVVHDYNTRELERWLAYDLDAIVFSDDWGSQWQLLIPPRIWRAFFAPCYEEMFSRVHEAGKLVFFHSDGYIVEVIEDLIALGVDALNSQVWCMGVEEMGERFRGRICFWGELDRQHTLPHGTPEGIRAAARRMKRHLETPEGGLIGEGEAGVDVPLENIEAMLSCWD